jgi:hypothetical protein
MVAFGLAWRPVVGSCQAKPSGRADERYPEPNPGRLRCRAGLCQRDRLHRQLCSGHRAGCGALAVPCDADGDGLRDSGAGGGADGAAALAEAALGRVRTFGDSRDGDADLLWRAGLPAGGAGCGRAVHRPDLRPVLPALPLWPADQRVADHGRGDGLCRCGPGPGARGAVRGDDGRAAARDLGRALCDGQHRHPALVRGRKRPSRWWRASSRCWAFTG